MRLPCGSRLCTPFGRIPPHPRFKIFSQTDSPRRPACHVERQVFARCVHPQNGLPRDRFVRKAKWVSPLVNKMPLCSIKMQACFGRDFLLDRSVSADDRVTSLTGVEPAATGQNGSAAFATTRWSMVVAAQGKSPEANKALEKLCRTYWWPIYSFIRRQGAGLEEAKDLYGVHFPTQITEQLPASLAGQFSERQMAAKPGLKRRSDCSD